MDILFLKVQKMVLLCRLILTFTNSLDPSQVRQNARPDLDPTDDTLKILNKVNFEKNISRQQDHETFPSMQRVDKGCTTYRF